jgi:tRNA(fMet)-specific endonuclease VapC
MVCLDTSVLVAILRRDQKTIDRLRVESDLNSEISTTVINLCELYSGTFGSRDPQREMEKVKNILSHFRLLELNESASKRYGELVNNTVLKRNPIGDFDLLIGCIAIEYNETIATRNLGHFQKIPELRVEVW